MIACRNYIWVAQRIGFVDVASQIALFNGHGVFEDSTPCDAVGVLSSSSDTAVMVNEVRFKFLPI